jgi:leucyl aminopeptidase (aminopeptidase T)
MNTKKIDISNVKVKFFTAIDTAKNSAKKANNYALNTTEEVVLETITVATEWQKVSEKALKGGVKLMASQQDLVFNTLEIFKFQLLDGKKKLSKIFA